MAKSQHVVVDGSNLATEGRTLPSLAQLDEAVRTFADEHPGSIITVVVDASFEHRIDESERETVRDAMLNGELVSPPAGAIGRGDAFVLRIAERTGAMVLSNDSFQEFHGQHPWLFDDGRLIGGKPVPGVGWIFTPRLPIRGPKSRAATELAKATKKVEKRGRGRSAAPAPEVDGSWPLTPATPPPARKADRVLTSAIKDAVAEAIDPDAPAKPSRKKAAAKALPADKVTKGSKKAATKKQAPVKASTPAKKSVAKKDATKKAAAPQKEAATKKAAAPKKEAPGKKVASTKKAAGAKKAAAQPDAPARGGKSRQAPPPAVNAPLVFINFVAAFPVGTTVEGTVISFTSHGAMVDVAVPDDGALHCYIPLSAMGDPPPTKARQMLTKGEVRPFVLARLDPPRRVAELALPAPPPKKRRSPAKKAAKASS